MLEAYSPRNETIVTLIRDKKRFDQFTPSDVIGRILTFDMQREEALERRKIGELQAKLEGMKIKDIALKANMVSKNSYGNKGNFSKEQEPGEHEHLADDGEEREDGQIPRPLPPGPIYALGLGVEVLGPTQRVHLLEQVKVEALVLELGDTPGQEQRILALPCKEAFQVDLHVGLVPLSPEHGERGEQQDEMGDPRSLHGATEAVKEERKRSRTEVAWKVKKA
ncbi:hypothetical protein ZEAMMB73_Zm00001d019384 [Zea mays]|uniref:Uncharacterized protein n=1 Tax=Zea mays TaxID=4577 RepID=A0A1D6HX85_MAIZE|nr:hypothetical protein ZEAMMB73_Zm00001d019384 [Zea mays]